MKNLIVLTGAGISAESGLKTFRDNGGLWEEYSVYDVATPEAWEKNPALVLDFYNQRRKQLLDVKPNQAHLLLKELEDHFRVRIITQNVDDLHERAGSSFVMHLHGELKKARSSVNPDYVVDIEGWELCLGQRCPANSQLRPHVVWFGEEVPMMHEASRLMQEADILLIVGTSLNVYPAAGLAHSIDSRVPVYVVDPGEPNRSVNAVHIKDIASRGLQRIKSVLLKEHL